MVGKVLITGGAGFVGSNLALAFKQKYPETTIHVLDNLRRRGSEFNLPALKKSGITFFHGDLRVKEDLEELPLNYDLMIDASAEPSVLAGVNGSPNYALSTNLLGTMHSLEFARKRADRFLFLSTSRVYSIQELKNVALKESSSRFEVADESKWKDGISEEFPTSGSRSIYGATKLASELLIEEYFEQYGLKSLINRCGVIVGPGQFGKTDQGVFTFWVARHYFKQSLSYTGFGGTGKQVRDLLHPMDLFELIEKQLLKPEKWNAEFYNVGGGSKVSTSLLEWTALCEKFTENKISIFSDTKTSGVDIPFYISNFTKCAGQFDWSPSRTKEDIVRETVQWIRSNELLLKEIFL